MAVACGNSNHIAKKADPLNRGAPCYRCPISKLAVSIISPCPDTPIILHSKGGVVPCSNSSHTAKTAHLNRGVPVNPCPITELAGSIISPCPDPPIILHGKRMVRSCGNSSHTTKSSDLNKLDHRNRGIPVNCSPIPELASFIISSPCADTTITNYSKRMGISCSNSSRTAKTAHLNRGIPHSCSPIPELAPTIFSPCPDTPIILHGKRMIGSCGNSNDTAKTTHLNRGVPVNPSPIPELAVSIISPCPDTPIILHGKRMIGSCGNS